VAITKITNPENDSSQGFVASTTAAKQSVSVLLSKNAQSAMPKNWPRGRPCGAVPKNRCPYW
jgi:hypothetical protein